VGASSGAHGRPRCWSAELLSARAHQNKRNPPRTTRADGLRAAFAAKGWAVADATVMKEPGAGGRSRGFGYVRLKTKASADAALREGSMHIDGRRVRQRAPRVRA